MSILLESSAKITQILQDTVWVVKSISLQNDAMTQKALEKYINDPWYRDLLLVLTGALLPFIATQIADWFKEIRKRKTEREQFLRVEQQRNYHQIVIRKENDMQQIREIVAEASSLITPLCDSFKMALTHSLEYYRFKSMGSGQMVSYRDLSEDYRQKFVESKTKWERELERFKTICGERADFYNLADGVTQDCNPDYYRDMDLSNNLQVNTENNYMNERDNVIVKMSNHAQQLMARVVHYMRSFNTAYLYSDVWTGDAVEQERIDYQFNKE